MNKTAGEKRLEQLFRRLKKGHKKHIGFRYPDAEGQDSNRQSDLRLVEDIRTGESIPVRATDVFDSFASWYLDNCHYQILEKKDRQTARDYYTLGAAYAGLAVSTSAAAFRGKCTEGSYQSDAVFEHISRALIAGWEEDYVQMNEWAIESIDYGRHPTKQGGYDKLFIGNGNELYLVLWFLLDLYCSAYGRSYSAETADYPPDMTPYDQVLQRWDTKDLTEVDRLVYVLCEHHLAHTDYNSDNDFYPFGNPDYWLYPYEILSWLKLRELRGLKNPASFSHALMNTEIARFFLELETPLTRPADLPYAKELLERLHAICPEVEIPSWLS